MKLPENEQTSGESQTLQIIEALLESINKTHSFKSKWFIISNKLSDIKTHITDLTSSSPNTLTSDVLRSLNTTIIEALALSSTCQTENLSTGKLKTQNDVDSLTSKLDKYLRDFHVIVISGVLDDDVRENVVITKNESVRIHFRNLTARLQISSKDQKGLALDTVLRLFEKDDKNVVIGVGQGLVPVLVRLLDSGQAPEITEKAVSAIARVSSIDTCRDVLNKEGLLLLHYLIRLLECSESHNKFVGFATEKACITLKSLTFSSKENAIVVGSRGGVSSLLRICESGTPRAQACAAGVLRNISAFSDLRERFIEEHAISVLLTLASSGIVLAQENAIACLSNIVRDDDDLRLLVARKSGIDSLKTFWDGDSGSSEVAVEFLSNLASDQRLIELIISNGFLNLLVNVMNCGVLSIRIHAADAIYKMGYNDKTRKELGEFGFISLLIRMLDAKAIEEVEVAVKAIWTILLYTENVRIYKKDQRGIVSIVRLLDPLLTSLDKKYPLSILMLLTRSKKCRKQMVNSGALLHLEKLVAMEVDGAKKLQESIGGGKLWGVFKRS